MQISELKLNKSNPRFIKDDKFKKLVKSIKEFPKMMDLRPIVIDGDGTILGGNMRYRALLELGYKELPDNWVKKASELTAEEKQRFIIQDNTGMGEWDFEMLNNEWDVELLDDWGVDMSEWDENFDTIENNDLDLSQNKNDVYGGNSLPVRIGNFIGYFQDEQLADFLDKFAKKFEFEDEKHSQILRNEACNRIVALIKANEDSIMA